MNNKSLLALLAAVSLVTSTAAFAAQQAASGSDANAAAASTAAGELVEGEVRKIDTANKKITLKHGEIKNLGMPGMTMVFQVKDASLLDKVKVGDKVRFAAEKSNGAIVITELQPAQ
ncbi:copper-binding protein [Caldimonas brevitalea]|uniref:Copper tolerance protein n=1 Tax=Caldimonas brevitalea TaxID=413882 RepID=A0A0G3BMR7_9BURK|nr:copper-binding protein [Caldimonas brevitalea]AKJ30712.1 copper tolerance protein [Caldimonas brevitalea]